MKGLIQRVSNAAVTVDNNVVGAIDRGIVLLLGIQQGDTQKSADWLVERVLNYRIFPDEQADQQGRMNCNVQQVSGGVLIVSQFTLVADTRKGLRPSFSSAAEPQEAERLYHYFVTRLKERYASVQTGVFGADMQVSLCNDGPVTFMLEAPT